MAFHSPEQYSLSDKTKHKIFAFPFFVPFGPPCIDKNPHMYIMYAFTSSASIKYMYTESLHHFIWEGVLQDKLNVNQLQYILYTLH